MESRDRLRKRKSEESYSKTNEEFNTKCEDADVNKAINEFIFAINQQIKMMDNISEDFDNLLKESSYSMETFLDEMHNGVELIVQNSQVVKYLFLVKNVDERLNLLLYFILMRV